MQSKYPPLVIDLHTHLFNARYVPLEGILREKKVPRWLASLVSALINLLTGKTDFHEQRGKSFEDTVAQTEDLDVLGEALTEVAVGELGSHLVQGGYFRIPVIEDRLDFAKLQSDLRADPLYAVLEDIEQAYLSEVPDTRPDAQFEAFLDMLADLDRARDLSDLELFKTLHKGLFGRFVSPLRWLVRKMERRLATDGYGTALDYVKFFLLMLSSEAKLLQQLFSGYREEQNAKLALHLMMDMQHAYTGSPSPYYPFEEQVRRMGHLVDSAEGKLVGLVAFDPRREESQEIVESGMALGNCGVKIYPPMGYHPFGNDELQRTRFQRLYQWCVTNNIPVLTHCTAEGFQAYDGSGVLSDPDNWEEVLDAFPQLKLCYGHAGGGESRNYPPHGDEKVKYPGWCASSADEWDHKLNFARKVVEHCLSRPNVYCDFSHIHEVLDDDDMADHFKHNLITAYERTDGTYAFADKAMYGSDWHMPRMARRAGDYLDHMIELFDSSEALSRHKDKFFYQNALRFLNLERNVERHRFMSGGSISARTLTALADRGN